MALTPRQQRAAMLRELERTMRDRDRAKLRELRAAVREAREAKRSKLAAVRTMCRSERARLAARAAELRAELRETNEQRRTAKTSCSVARIEARTKGDAAIADAARAARRERSDQRLIRGQKQSDKPKITARERREESDDEVRANIPRELVPLFEKMRRHVKASGRRSRTEAFLEWVHDHPHAVWELHEAQEAEELARLEREQRALEQRMRRPAAYRRRARELAEHEVPF